MIPCCRFKCARHTAGRQFEPEVGFVSFQPAKLRDSVFGRVYERSTHELPRSRSVSLRIFDCSESPGQLAYIKCRKSAAINQLTRATKPCTSLTKNLRGGQLCSEQPRICFRPGITPKQTHGSTRIV